MAFDASRRNGRSPRAGVFYRAVDVPMESNPPIQDPPLPNTPATTTYSQSDINRGTGYGY